VLFRSPELYRGAQPDAAGIRKLKELGVKTIVNLRLAHSDADEIGGLDIASEHIRMDALKPEMDELVRFLRIATDPNRTPVFVHCQRGTDRTGLAAAVYRIVVCGWTKTQALDEMLNGPFGYDGLFPNVPVFLDSLDVAELRRRAEQRQQGK
jgi:tyrosine-protein phosphatase SIW14